MSSHEADLQRKLQEARAEIIRLKSVGHRVDEDGRHSYISTYCLHGQHGECRRTCKVCGNPCLCGCGHERPEPPAARPWKSFRNRGTLPS